MAQHIGIKIVRDGKQVILFDGNFATVFNAIENISLYHYISKISAYSDTSFNFKDTKKLILELGKLKKDYEHIGVIANKIISFLKKCKNHDIVIFIGD